MGSMNKQTHPTQAPMQDLDAVKAFAKKVTAKLVNEGYTPEALHTYTHKTGEALCYVAKLKHENGDKQLRPISHNGQQYQLKQPDWSEVYHADGLKPLYNLAGITYPQPNQTQVWIVEGEKDADNLNKLGLLATTSIGGANGVNSTHWQPLAGQKCMIWRDNDTAGQSYAEDVINQLAPLDCDIWLVDIDQLDLPDKGDASDWIAQQGDIATAELVTRLSALPLVDHVADKSKPDATDATPDAGDAMTDEQVDTLIYELAELNQLAYERRRADAASLAGIRASALDKLVKEARKELEAGSTDLQCNEFIQPYSEPVDGEQLLDDIVGLVNRFIVCEPTTSHAVALWVTYTWCIDAFAIAPIANITAPAKRCGKTELLTLMGKMVKRPQEASFISPAALFRIVDEYQPTLLIDEADAFMNQDEDMRGLINLGHARGKQVLRCVGDDNNVKGFNVFGAKVISGISKVADTIRDRSIVLELRRKLPNEERDKQRHLDSEVTEDIKARLARWADDHIELLRQTRPELPQVINDRAQDNWEGLLAIASLVSDDWMKRATQAAITLSGVVQEEPSINEQLLADIQEVFDKRKSERIFTSVLIDELCSDEEAPWSSYNFRSKDKRINSRQLSKKLSGYGIKSKDIRMGSDVKKGYHKSDFSDAFKRYASATPDLPATTLHPNDSKGYGENLNATNTKPVADKKTLKANDGGTCSGVADKTPPPEQDTLKSDNVAVNSQPETEGKGDVSDAENRPSYLPPPNKINGVVTV